jgi:hypothetical protein
MLMRLPLRQAAVAACVMCPSVFPLAGCGGGQAAPSATPSIALATESVDRARTDGALQSAGTPLLEAQRKLGAAQEAAARGENDKAIRLATEAKADADLADTTARAAEAERASAAVKQDTDMLRQQGTR